ncbi:MAG TPA: THUMP domain-containing protein, partial [Limnobacter sp.]|nr:THUMP domain-containing protein [Limnobacter sp.]
MQNSNQRTNRENSSTRPVYNCFASCPRGLETLLLQELETMGAKRGRVVTGGCTFEASWRQATRMTYWTRFAGRIGLELARGPCSSDEDLYKLAKSVDWSNWFKLSHTFRVDLNNLGADLKSPRFTQLRLKDGVCDAFNAQFDERPSVSTDAPDVRIFAAVTPTEAMIYIDLAGENLFKRGWRQEQGVAPLKENLAAGLWQIARQSQAGQAAQVFLDPFCGSGTLVIESLCALCDRAPGLERAFAFENLKPFKPEWGQELQ